MTPDAGLHARVVGLLGRCRSRDGGFAATPGGPSEVEPSAIASIALDDPGARRWLAGAEGEDGGFTTADGRDEGPTAAALAALALAGMPASARALDHAIAHRARPLGAPRASDDGRRQGWGWTVDTTSLVEPTSRVLLATRVLRPAERDVVDEGLGILHERRCAEGGWNFGSARVNEVDLRSYGQTTAVALLALQGGPADLVGPALSWIRRAWRDERGGLTLAQVAVALRLHDVAEDETAAVVRALRAAVERTSLLEDGVALAWAVLATGSEARLDPLRRSL